MPVESMNGSQISPIQDWVVDGITHWVDKKNCSLNIHPNFNNCTCSPKIETCLISSSQEKEDHLLVEYPTQSSFKTYPRIATSMWPRNSRALEEEKRQFMEIGSKEAQVSLALWCLSPKWCSNPSSKYFRHPFTLMSIAWLLPHAWGMHSILSIIRKILRNFKLNSSWTHVTGSENNLCWNLTSRIYFRQHSLLTISSKTVHQSFPRYFQLESQFWFQLEYSFKLNSSWTGLGHGGILGCGHLYESSKSRCHCSTHGCSNGWRNFQLEINLKFI